ncbi:MAG: MATE family efflux transporter [Pseudomonadota bacterium]
MQSETKHSTASTSDQSPPPHKRRYSNLEVLAIALPITFSNATTPLVGYADTVVIGQIGSETLMGGVAIASNIFSYIYWIFGFLRMGTTGLTAQAVGADDGTEVAANLWRALLVAAVCGLLLVCLQSIIGPFALWAMGASEGVQAAAGTYFTIRIWGAPAALANFALVGWFIGIGRADIAFWLQLLLNAINIALAVVLVSVYELGVAGVGIAVLAAEVVAAGVGLVIALRNLRARGARADRNQVLNALALFRTFAVNRDILIRTACLLFALAFFHSQGARAGDLTLASNALLHSLAMICIYMLDGFAFAAESLVGRAVGARDRYGFRITALRSTFWAASAAAVLTTVMFIGGPFFIDFATTSPAVREMARVYLIWAALLPIVAVWCFQLDGIFIGATETAEMRNMMILSLILYLVAALTLKELLHNHGLWLSLYVLFIARTVALGLRYPVIEKRIFTPTER